MPKLPALPAAMLLLLAACDPAPAPPAAPATLGKLPAEVCTGAADALEKLADSGVFEHDGKGQATIAETPWFALGATGQDNLTRALAIDAACKEPEVPREMPVSVRSETGRQLTSRVVEIAPGADALFGEE